jgi:hypothetical protein
MKRIALATLRCAQDMVSVRKGSFELYGFDFLIDSCLDVWLLEVNCSPTLEASTPITERMCAELQVGRVGGKHTRADTDTDMEHIRIQIQMQYT